MRHGTSPALLLLTLLGGLFTEGAPGQPVPSQPLYSVSTVTSQIPLQGEATSLAVDREGWVYIVEENLAQGGGVVHRVRTNGSSLTLDFLTGLSDPGQLARHPLDGRVRLPDPGPAGTLTSQIWRFDPAGPTADYLVPGVRGQGFAIDNAGSYYLVGPGTQGVDLYRFSPAAGTSLPYGSGIAADALVLATNSAVFYASGGLCFSQGGQLFAGPPTTLPLADVTALVANPFTAPGPGVLVAFHHLDPACACGATEVRFGEPLMGPPPGAPSFLTETFATPHRGARLWASGLRRDLYALSTRDVAGMRFATLHRIEQVPTAGYHGHLVVQRSGNQVSTSLTGLPTTAGLPQPFLLGMRALIGPQPPGLFLPTIGILDVHAGDPYYVPVIDGLGLFGPPHPLGLIPPSGTFSLTFAAPPPLPIPLVLEAQAVLLDGPASPSGIMTISDVALLVL